MDDTQTPILIDDDEWYIDKDAHAKDRKTKSKRKNLTKSSDLITTTFDDPISRATSSLLSRFNLQLPSLDGDKPIVSLGGDSGYRNLALALGICWRPVPEFDATWQDGQLNNAQPKHKKLTEGELSGTQQQQQQKQINMEDGRQRTEAVAPSGHHPEPAHILAVAHIDLTPSMEFGGDPKLTVYHSELLVEFTNEFDKELNKRIESMRDAFMIAEGLGEDEDEKSEVALAIDLVTQRLTDQNLFHRLDFALEYTMYYDSPYNVTRQLCKALLHPDMRWLWLMPGPFHMENQVQQIKMEVKKRYFWQGRQKNQEATDSSALQTSVAATAATTEDEKEGVEPIVWLIANLMQGLLMQMDILLFGTPRVCRLLAKKFGAKDEALTVIVHKLHAGVTNKYTMRKLMSVEAVKIYLRATSQLDLFYWISIYLKDLGISDRDVCDAIALVLERFSSGTRDKAYTQPERKRIEEYKKKFQEEQRLSRDKNHLKRMADVFTTKKFRLDQKDETKRYLQRERVRLSRELAPFRAKKSGGKQMTIEEVAQAKEDAEYEAREAKLAKEREKILDSQKTNRLDFFAAARRRTSRPKAKAVVTTTKSTATAVVAQSAPIAPSKPQVTASEEDLKAVEDMILNDLRTGAFSNPIHNYAGEEDEFAKLLSRKRDRMVGLASGGNKTVVSVDLKLLGKDKKKPSHGREQPSKHNVDDPIEDDEDDDSDFEDGRRVKSNNKRKQPTGGRSKRVIPSAKRQKTNTSNKKKPKPSLLIADDEIFGDTGTMSDSDLDGELGVNFDDATDYYGTSNRGGGGYNNTNKKGSGASLGSFFTDWINTQSRSGKGGTSNLVVDTSGGSKKSHHSSSSGGGYGGHSGMTASERLGIWK